LHSKRRSKKQLTGGKNLPREAGKKITTYNHGAGRWSEKKAGDETSIQEGRIKNVQKREGNSCCTFRLGAPKMLGWGGLRATVAKETRYPCRGFPQESGGGPPASDTDPDRGREVVIRRRVLNF